MTLRKLLISSQPVSVEQLQLALQWQYDLLRNSRVDQSSSDLHNDTMEDLQHSSSEPELMGSGDVPPSESKLLSLGSFDSGFGQLEAHVGRGGMDDIGDPMSPGLRQPQIQEEMVCSVSDCGPKESDFGSVGNSSRASVQAPPKGQVNAMNLEIKENCSAASTTNRWLSPPADDGENSYTVTITPSPTPQRRGSHDASDLNAASTPSRDQPTQTESQSSLEDPKLSLFENLLSGTITEGDGRSTEEAPTLLRDIHDLHRQKPDAASR